MQAASLKVSSSRSCRRRHARGTSPLGDAVETFVRREDADRFIEEVRGDDPDLASHLRIEKREVEVGWRSTERRPPLRRTLWFGRFGRCCCPPVAHLRVEEGRLGHVLVEQVDVRVERERRLVMPEMALYLRGVQACLLTGSWPLCVRAAGTSSADASGSFRTSLSTASVSGTSGSGTTGPDAGAATRHRP
jgi:hypothetical protein